MRRGLTIVVIVSVEDGRDRRGLVAGAVNVTQVMPREFATRSHGFGHL